MGHSALIFFLLACVSFSPSIPSTYVLGSGFFKVVVNLFFT